MKVSSGWVAAVMASDLNAMDAVGWVLASAAEAPTGTAASAARVAMARPLERLRA